MQPLSGESRQALIDHFRKEAERARDLAADFKDYKEQCRYYVAVATTMERCAYMLDKCA